MQTLRPKIAFDLDDTLIPTTTTFAVGSQKSPFPLNLFFKEELRIGTIDLMKELSQEYDLWIYTTSLRSELYIKLWFCFLWVEVLILDANDEEWVFRVKEAVKPINIKLNP